MKAVVLAGGEGTRLRPLTLTRPKPMIPLGRHPAIQYTLMTLARMGFNDVVMVVGYKRDQIIGHFGDGHELGISLKYVSEPHGVFFGTAGSLKLADDLLDDTFIVVQGDTIFEIPVNEMVAFHEAGDYKTGTIALTEVDNPSHYGVATLSSESRILGFQEKPRLEEASSHWASTGIYVLDPEILDYIDSERWDFALDLFPHLLSSGKKLYGFRSKAFWTDIGELEGFLRGSRWVLSRTFQESQFEQPVHESLDSTVTTRDASFATESYSQGPVLVEDTAIVEEGARLLPYTIVKANARISAGSTIEGSVVLERAQVGKNSVVASSIVGQAATIGADATIRDAIVGQGSIIGDRAKLLTGSRVWQNMTIGPGETVEGVVAVSREKAFQFYVELGQYAGTLATSIEEFIRALETAPVRSLSFHTQRRDFEKWLREVIGSDEIAERIGDLRRSKLEGEQLRAALVQLMNEWRREMTNYSRTGESQRFSLLDAGVSSKEVK